MSKFLLSPKKAFELCNGLWSLSTIKKVSSGHTEGLKPETILDIKNLLNQNLYSNIIAKNLTSNFQEILELARHATFSNRKMSDEHKLEIIDDIKEIKLLIKITKETKSELQYEESTSQNTGT